MIDTTTNLSERVIAYRVVQLGEVLCVECAISEQEWILEDNGFDPDPADYPMDRNGILIGYHEIRPGEFDFEPLYEWEVDEDWECG